MVSLLGTILMKSNVIDWCDHKFSLGLAYIIYYLLSKCALILNGEFSFVEIRTLARLVDNEATAIIPVAVTIGRRR